MGRKARAQRHTRIMQQKRAIKAARRALYESYRNSGSHKKPRSSQGSGIVNTIATELMLVPVLIKGEVVKALRRVHGGPKCKNIGCKRCSSIFHAPVAKMEVALVS